MHSLKLATNEDWPDILDFSRKFHAFSPYREYPFNDNKVRHIFEKYMADPTEVIIVLGQVDGHSKGIIVGAVSELYFSDFKSAGEIIWWVDEEYRRTTSLGIQLYKALEFWARKVGAQVLSCVSTEGTTALGKFYERNGCHLAESVYIKELN